MDSVRSVTFFRSLGEVVDLVERFEDDDLPADQWDHAAHLTVAIWYMLHLEEARATERYIKELLRYNRVHGIRERPNGGYHETLTLFWLAMTRSYLRRAELRKPVLDLVNGFLREYGDRKGLYLEYYREKTIWSQKARYSWLEPDLQPLNRTTD